MHRRRTAAALGFLTAASLAILPTSVRAQVVASERSQLAQQISGTEVIINYSRPSARGREPLFGGVVHWGENWTPGANMSTTFHFSRDVTLNGTEVPAGTYGIWMQPREAQSWLLALHSDTALFHTVHPEPSLAFLTLPVEATSGGDFIETLTFDIDAVRADGAVLRMSWGRTRVDVALGVDAGYVLTLEADEAARYEGMWIVDRSMGVPPDSVVAEWKREDPHAVEEIDRFIDSLREPVEIRFVYDAPTSRLLGFEPSSMMMQELNGGDPSQPLYLLVPKAEGIFLPGLLMNGELAFLGDGGLLEFEFGPDGRAVSLVERGYQDEIQGRGTRSGG